MSWGGMTPPTMTVEVDLNYAFFPDYGQWWGVAPAPPEDPHGYLRFEDSPLAWQGRLLHERWLVRQYDHYRQAPHEGGNSEMLDLLREDLTRARKDESPGHLDGGACIVSRMRHHDASLGRGLHIDGRVARAGRCDQLQSRQAPDD